MTKKRQKMIFNEFIKSVKKIGYDFIDQDEVNELGPLELVFAASKCLDIELANKQKKRK